MYFVSRGVFLTRLIGVPSPRLTFGLAVSCLANFVFTSSETGLLYKQQNKVNSSAIGNDCVDLCV